MPEDTDSLGDRLNLAERIPEKDLEALSAALPEGGLELTILVRTPQDPHRSVPLELTVRVTECTGATWTPTIKGTLVTLKRTTEDSDHAWFWPGREFAGHVCRDATHPGLLELVQPTNAG